MFLTAAALLTLAPISTSLPGDEIVVCSRTVSFEDQHCAAATEGRRWGHREAALAHEIHARFALPHRAAHAYLAAANNWVAAREPAKALAALDRALAEALKGEERQMVIATRARVLRLLR